MRVSPSRRRLLRGGLGAAPVLMTLASRPVGATVCTTGSAFASLQPSGTLQTTQCTGHSPSYWTACSSPGTDWKPIKPQTKFSALFTPALSDSNVTLKKVVDASLGYNVVARHCVAALLNASKSPPLTPPSILSAAMVKAVWTSYATHGYYEPTAGIQWTDTKIVDWITTTYA
jgi:hypothetical protein